MAILTAVADRAPECAAPPCPTEGMLANHLAEGGRQV